jgi:hypothetical protein
MLRSSCAVDGGNTLAFLILFHVFLCKIELLALFDVQVDLMPDVGDNGCALDAVRIGWTLVEWMTLLPRQCHRGMSTCSLPKRWLEQTGSVSWVSI